MSDLLEQASAWLDEQRMRHLSRTVVYERDGEFVEVSATVGQTIFLIDESYGATIRHVRRDYLIATADLVLNEQPTLPKRGDRIKETHDGKVFIHEVMGPGGNEPDWRYSDPYRRTLRIHTKQVGLLDV